MKSKVDKELASLIKVRIETLMIQNNVSRENLAKEAGIDVATLSKKLNGYTNWKLPECIAICKFFGVEMNYIFLPLKLQKSIEKEVE